MVKLNKSIKCKYKNKQTYHKTNSNPRYGCAISAFHCFISGPVNALTPSIHAGHEVLQFLVVHTFGVRTAGFTHFLGHDALGARVVLAQIARALLLVRAGRAGQIGRALHIFGARIADFGCV